MKNLPGRSLRQSSVGNVEFWQHCLKTENLDDKFSWSCLPSLELFRTNCVLSL